MEYFVVAPILFWLWQRPPASGEAKESLPTDHPAAAALGVALVLSGVGHILVPQYYVQFLPSMIPHVSLMCVVGGWIRMALGFSLMQKEARPAATLLTFVMLVALIPSAIRYMLEGQASGSTLFAWGSACRLALHMCWLAWTIWVFLPSEVWGTSGSESHAQLHMHLKPRRVKIRPRRVASSRDISEVS